MGFGILRTNGFLEIFRKIAGNSGCKDEPEKLLNELACLAVLLRVLCMPRFQSVLPAHTATTYDGQCEKHLVARSF